MQEKIFGQIRMNEIIEKKKKSDIKLQSLMSKAEKMDKIIVDKERVELEINRLDLANKQLQYLPILWIMEYMLNIKKIQYFLWYSMLQMLEKTVTISQYNLLSISERKIILHIIMMLFSLSIQTVLILERIPKLQSVIWICHVP